MKELDRLLDAWVLLSPRSRTLLLDIVDALLDRHTLYPTSSTHPTRVNPATRQINHIKQCPICAQEVLSAAWQRCPECGSVLPVFNWT